MQFRDRFPEGIVLQQSYDIVCVQCSHVYRMRPSIMMIMGYNEGVWTCKECRTFHAVYIDIDAADGDQVAVSARFEKRDNPNTSWKSTDFPLPAETTVDDATAR